MDSVPYYHGYMPSKMTPIAPPKRKQERERERERERENKYNNKQTKNKNKTHYKQKTGYKIIIFILFYSFYKSYCTHIEMIRTRRSKWWYRLHIQCLDTDLPQTLT